jgi:TolB protein
MLPTMRHATAWLLLLTSIVCLVAAGALGAARSQATEFIAYGGAGGVSVIDLEGKPVSELPLTGCPAWSPDGGRLAAADTPIGEERLFVADVQRRTLHAVARGALYNHGRPAWSPNGRNLVFNQDGGRLMVASADGISARVLTKQPVTGSQRVHVEDWDPVWSPDGKTIAFTRTRLDVYAEGRPGAATPADVFVIGANGKGLRRLIRNASGASWSPNGREIAYVRAGAGLWVARADGTDARQLSARRVLPRVFELDRRRLFAPVWAPDGAAVAFQSFVSNSRRWELFTVKADGSNERNLTQSGADERTPSWAPDGKAIVYSRTQRGIKQIYRMDADGKEQRALTQGGRGGWFDDCPAWSP